MQLNKSILKMKSKEISKSLPVKKHRDISKSVKVFLGMVLPGCVKMQKKDCLFLDNPYFTSRAGQAYPWQVAPQQSLFPFLPDNAKVSIVEEKKIFCKRKCLPLQKNVKQ